MTKVLDFIVEKFSPRKKDATEDMQKRLDELSILNKLSVALSSGQDLYHLLRLLLEELKNIFIMDEFYIGIYHPETAMVNFPVYFKDDQFIEIAPRNLREQPGLTGAVIFSEKTLYIPDQSDPQVIQQYKPLNTGQRRSRSYIGIPLMLNNAVIGVLSVQSAQPNVYTPQQIQLLETIAAQSATAIDKARLFSELQNQLTEHKQSEEALRKNEARYRAVIENQTEFIVRWKLDGTRTFVNDAYCRYFNIPPEQALSTNFIPLIVEDDRPHMEERITRLLSGVTDTESYIQRVVRPDQSIGWQEWTDHTIRDEGRQVVEIQSVGRDITERIKIEQELRETNERFHQMADNIQEVFWIGDPLSHENIYTSPAYEKLWGFDQHTATQLDEFYKVVLPQDLPMLQAAIEKQSLGEKTEVEYRIRHPDGSIRWIWERAFPFLDGSGKTTRVAGVVTDITERKTAEFRYRTLIEQIPPIIFIAARDQHVGVTYISPRIASLGFNQAEWVADPELWLRQVHPDDQARVLEEIEEVKRSGEPFKSEYRLRTHDGVAKWFLDESMDVLDGDGNFLFRQGFMLDIDERKRVEEVVRQREAILGAIAFAAEQFFKTTDWRDNINIVLERLGKVIDCTHVYIFENLLDHEKRPTSRMTYEWTAARFHSDLGDEKYQSIVLQEDGFDYWYQLLSNNESFVSSSASLPDNEREELNARGIKALVDVPIFVKGRWWGIIGFDDMAREREWSIAELDALRVAANVFGAAIQRQLAEDEIHRINLELEERIEQRTVQLQQANQSLNQEKARLEQYTRQREIMSAMTDLLQASLSMKEASVIIATHLKLLFPNRDGALYLSTFSNSFEPVAIWGDEKSLDTIYTTNECWALRRGKPYHFGSGFPNPPCEHVGAEMPRHALCIPFSAQGESLGNFHISTKSSLEDGFINDEERKFIETIADSIALAIANLRLRERLHFESIRDGLTGLFNRRYLDETLPREIHRAERSNRPISVFMFDIDRFKKFNDTFGHDAGDVVLKSMAGLMMSGIRESDIACRYGGEEFVIILPDTPIEVAARRAENLRHETSLMELHHNGQNLGTVTISIGVATYPQHGTARDALIKSADEAAYQAKEGGRNRVVVCK